LRKILIADNDRDFRELVKFVLRFAGYDVFDSSNGEECCTVAKQTKPDLILLSDHLPGMSGNETYKLLKLDKETATIPLVFILARGDESEGNTSKENCGMDIIYKPIEPDPLTRRINKYFKKLNP
jgi:DNA-binding response OmpR family regulator